MNTPNNPLLRRPRREILNNTSAPEQQEEETVQHKDKPHIVDSAGELRPEERTVPAPQLAEAVPVTPSFSPSVSLPVPNDPTPIEVTEEQIMHAMKKFSMKLPDPTLDPEDFPYFREDRPGAKVNNVDLTAGSIKWALPPGMDDLMRHYLLEHFGYTLRQATSSFSRELLVKAGYHVPMEYVLMMRNARTKRQVNAAKSYLLKLNHDILYPPDEKEKVQRKGTLKTSPSDV